MDQRPPVSKIHPPVVPHIMESQSIENIKNPNVQPPSTTSNSGTDSDQSKHFYNTTKNINTFVSFKNQDNDSSEEVLFKSDQTGITQIHDDASRREALVKNQIDSQEEPRPKEVIVKLRKLPMNSSINLPSTHQGKQPIYIVSPRPCVKRLFRSIHKENLLGLYSVFHAETLMAIREKQLKRKQNAVPTITSPGTNTKRRRMKLPTRLFVTPDDEDDEESDGEWVSETVPELDTSSDEEEKVSSRVSCN